MAAVAGIDLSTRAIDIVKLDETTNNATWHRIQPQGKNAWERLLNARALMPTTSWWDDVYMVAVERPYGVGKSIHDLMRAMGAVVAALPPALMVWELSPAEWRKGIGLPGNATKDECRLKVLQNAWDSDSDSWALMEVLWPQDALDAYAIAYTARAINQQAIEAA
jgi:hypothetical protein